MGSAPPLPMRNAHRFLLCLSATFPLACATPPAPLVSIARAERAVEQAETGDALEHAQIELRSSRAKLVEARRALDDRRYEEARRLADEALVEAELAQATAESATRVEDALSASVRAELLRDEIDPLRREGGRSYDTISH